MWRSGEVTIIRYHEKVFKLSQVANNNKSAKQLQQLCKKFSITTEHLTDAFRNKRITINFHPDRMTNNHKTVIQCLHDEGEYKNQYHSGISGGSYSPYNGGLRFEIEEKLFPNIYGDNFEHRPLYGAVNIFNYIDGAAPRFGSSYLVLNTAITDYVTYSFQDSSYGIDTFFYHQNLHMMLEHFYKESLETGVFVDRLIKYDEEFLSLIFHNSTHPKLFGTSLDQYIEAHIHHKVMLEKFVESLYLDGSYKGTEVEKVAMQISEKYDVDIHWIPERKIIVEDIDTYFRGPQVVELSKRIADTLTVEDGIITAEILGRAANLKRRNDELWSDLGDTQTVNQRIKQLWHTLAYWGK